MIRRLRARWQGIRADLATPFDFDLPEYPMDDPTEELQAAAQRIREDLIIPWDLVKPLAGLLDETADHAAGVPAGHVLDLARAILAHHQPAPTECEAGCRAANERARADALAARLHILQQANMAADVAPCGFATEEVARG